MKDKLVTEIEITGKKIFLRKWQSLIRDIMSLRYQWDIQTT